jgi:hypothetical protein
VKKPKNYIIWKEGDINDKLYIILKGTVRILHLKENDGECTKLEYLKYLIILYLYQEKCVDRIISLNSKIMNMNNNTFLTLLSTFKFYTIFKQNSNFNQKYNNLTNFIKEERHINEYIFKLFNCLPINSLKILDLSINKITELYDFYINMTEEINNELSFSQKLKYTIQNQNMNNESKITKRIMTLLDLYYQKGLNFKKYNELFEKISSKTEIEISKIHEISHQDYIDRLDFEKILQKIQKYDFEHRKFYKKTDISKDIVYLYYNEEAQYKNGNIIGELSLKDKNSIMTETIIIKDECYFGVITKELYDQSLKFAQDKLKVRNVLFLTQIPLFQGISMNYLKKYLQKQR